MSENKLEKLGLGVGAFVLVFILYKIITYFTSK